MFIISFFVKVLSLAADVLSKLPEPIDYEATHKLVSEDMTPLNIVLLQEVCLCMCVFLPEASHNECT